MHSGKIQQVIKKAVEYLQKADIDSPPVSAEELLMKVLSIPNRSGLYLDPDREVEPQQAKEYFELIKKRAEKVPLQHLLGVVHFYEGEFEVNSDVLIPRPETEVLVAEAIEEIKAHNYKYVLDIGTGSGAIIISIADACPLIDCTGVDISDRALSVARRNADKNDTKEIEFIKSDCLEALSGRRFDMIVSNPPYITKTEIRELDEEVLHDPMIALDGGEDGLDYYRRIIKEAGQYLRSGGTIIFEVGDDQARPVSEILINNGFEDIKCIKDYAQTERVVKARWSNG